MNRRGGLVSDAWCAIRWAFLPIPTPAGQKSIIDG